MQFTCNKIQVQEDSPADLIKKTAAEQWYVLETPILTPARWSVFRKGDRVAIPLFPYLLADDPLDLSGFMFQLGMLARDAMTHTVVRVHLSLGAPLEQVSMDDGSTAWRVWLGVAMSVR